MAHAAEMRAAEGKRPCLVSSEFDRGRLPSFQKLIDMEFPALEPVVVVGGGDDALDVLAWFDTNDPGVELVLLGRHLNPASFAASARRRLFGASLDRPGRNQQDSKRDTQFSHSGSLSRFSASKAPASGGGSELATE